MTCLTFSVESTGNLSTTERAVGEETAVFASERHALSDALVDNIVRHFGEAIHVGFASAIVATFHSVVEEAIDRVAVVLVVFGSVDTTLRSDRVSAARRVLDAEVKHVEAHLSQSRSGRSAGETGTNDDDVEFALIGGVYEFLVCFIVGPFLSNRTFGDFRVDNRLSRFNFFFHFLK